MKVLIIISLTISILILMSATRDEDEANQKVSSTNANTAKEVPEEKKQEKFVDSLLATWVKKQLLTNLLQDPGFHKEDSCFDNIEISNAALSNAKAALQTRDALWMYLSRTNYEGGDNAYLGCFMLLYLLYRCSCMLSPTVLYYCADALRTYTTTSWGPARARQPVGGYCLAQGQLHTSLSSVFFLFFILILNSSSWLHSSLLIINYSQWSLLCIHHHSSSSASFIL